MGHPSELWCVCVCVCHFYETRDWEDEVGLQEATGHEDAPTLGVAASFGSISSKPPLELAHFLPLPVMGRGRELGAGKKKRGWTRQQRRGGQPVGQAPTFGRHGRQQFLFAD